MEIGYRDPLPNGYEIEGYTVDGVLARGTTGFTYRAFEIANNRKVAIKEYCPDVIAGRAHDGVQVKPLGEGTSEHFRTGLEWFRQDVAVLASFDHPNIVPVEGVLNTNGTTYLIMPWLTGMTLDAILERDRVVTEPEVHEILFPIIDALEHIHESDSLHGELTPKAVFITADGKTMIFDFGITRWRLWCLEVIQDDYEQRDLLFPERNYTALEGFSECLVGFSEYRRGPWTDIYALAAILYRAAVGKPPAEVHGRLRNDVLVPAIVAAKGRFSHALLESIDWALSIEPSDRPQSIADWRRQLTTGA